MCVVCVFGLNEYTKDTACYFTRKHEKPLFHNARNKRTRILGRTAKRELPERCNYDAFKYVFNCTPFGVVQHASQSRAWRFLPALVVQYEFGKFDDRTLPSLAK